MTIDTLRYKKPQTFDLYLSIYRPKVLLTARINATVPRGSRTIPITTVTPVSDVVNRKMAVGSTSGEEDRGVVRVRSMDATSITVAENGDVAWTSGSYLTIYDYINVGSIYPRIIQDPSDPEKTIFYKDYDVAYTNQNTILGAFPCAGSHRAASIDPSLGYVDLYWTATGTYHVAGSSMSYAWEFDGATSGTANVQTPGYRRYTTPGNYVTKLTVTGANGSVDTTYRYVSIHSATSNPPVPNWKLSNLRGSRSGGGWSVDVSIDMWDLPYEVYGGELVVIYSNDYYGNTKEFIEFNGTQVPDGVKLIGYVLKDSVRYNYKSRTYTFSVGTINEVMKTSENFVISVESVKSPTTWFQLYDLTGSKAIYHYLKWHSTVLNVSDFRYTGNDFRIQYFDTEKTSLYDALNNFFSRAFVGQLVSNKKSQLWAETLPEASVTPTSARVPLFTVGKSDYIGTPSVDKRLYNSTCFIDLGGLRYDGPTTAESIPLLSASPSASPSSYGKLTSQTGLAVQSQEQLNQLAGNLYAKQNAKIPSILFQSNGYSALDIAPISYLSIAISKEDSGLFVDLSGTFLVEDIDRGLTSASFMDSVRLSPVIDGIPGETVDVPVNYGGDAGFSFTPITFPPLVFPPIPTPTLGDNLIVLIHVQNFGLWWTEDYYESDVSWWSMNGGLSGTAQLNYNFVDIGADGFVWAMNTTTLFGGFLKSSLSPLIDKTLFFPTYGSNAKLLGGCPNPFNSSQYILIAGDQFPPYPAHLYIVDRTTKSVTQKVELDTGSVFADDISISYGNHKYTMTKARGTLLQVDAEVSNSALSNIVFITDIINADNPPNHWHRRAGRSEIIYNARAISHSASSPTSGTWEKYSHSGTIAADYQGIHSTPDGNYFMAFVEETPRRLLRSSDGGTTWGMTPALTGTFPDLFPVGPIENMGTRDGWILSTRGHVPFTNPGYVLTTDDFGETWYDITGNLRDFTETYFQPKRVRVFWL